MVRLTVTLPGQPPAVVMLSRMAESVTDWGPFWTGYFVPQWYALETQQYATQGGATGAGWAALTKRYAAWKMKHYPGRPVGVLTGKTHDSLVGPGPHSVLQSGRSGFAIGTDLPYPIYLQMGTGRMVARPPMRVNAAFMTQVGKLMQKYAVDLARKQGTLPASRLT